MASLNKVMLIGNLTRDPEVRYTTSGAAVANFGLAMNRRYRTAAGEDRDDTCFVDVDMWGKTAETIKQYFHKGDPIFIEGRLKFEQWQDKATGQNRNAIRVHGENFQFLPKSTGGNQQSGDFGGNGGQQQTQGNPQQGFGGQQTPPPPAPQFGAPSPQGMQAMPAQQPMQPPQPAAMPQMAQPPAFQPQSQPTAPPAPVFEPVEEPEDDIPF